MFSYNETNEFTRTRHFDLQRAFKQFGILGNEERELVDELMRLFDVLQPAFEDLEVLRNRALTVATVLLAWRTEVKTPDEAENIATFMDEFVHRLRWQVRKGLQADAEYHYLNEFQRSVTQASAEKMAVTTRVSTMHEEFLRWSEFKVLRGDEEWSSHNSELDVSEESRS
ncbi:MAG: hypothetical protein F4Y88_01190 [Chloroflexi bacterium]|nr:hypothetical protein [Chloroflexota bacterium]